MSGIGSGISPFLSRPLPSGGSPPVSYTRAFGGYLSYFSGQKLHEYFGVNDTGAGFYLTQIGDDNAYRKLIVGGGAGGGNGDGTGAGGGAGGRVRDISETFTTTGLIPVVVGSGGAAGVGGGGNGSNGGDSSFNGHTSEGGGGGAGLSSNGLNGGNGGGGGTFPVGAIGGTGLSGFNGGTGLTFPNSAGGGAGAAENGQNAVTTVAGNGGAGLVSDITGSNVTYGGGGGGAAYIGGSGGLGGAGGGGNGNIRGTSDAQAGTNGLGGGAGGTALNGPGVNPVGGSGTVKVRYAAAALNSTLTEIFHADGDFSRYDSACIILLQNGTWLMAIQVYDGPDSGDFGGNVLNLYTSTNLTSWTYLSTIPSAFDTYLTPALRQKTNGDIYCHYSEVGPTNANIIKVLSTDNGATWGTPVIIRDETDEYLGFYNRPIFVTDTGRWLQAFEVATTNDHGAGPYDGYCMYSDDEGDNWTVSAYVIVNVTEQTVESGYYKDGTDIVRYWRTLNGPCFAAVSTDDGETYGTPYNTTLPTITERVNSPSTDTILELSNGHLIAYFNTVDRSNAMIAYSMDKVNWGSFLVINSSPGEQLIEAQIVELSGYVYIYYSISYASQTRFSFYVQKIKLDTYV